jgi:hypothetical protein
MTQGEHLRAFGDEQWGSRTDRNVIAVVLQSFVLNTSLIIIDLTKIDNDAKALFDRIIPAPIYLRSRQLGMPRSACYLHADLLLKALYDLKTEAGISDQSNSLYSEGQSGHLQRWFSSVHSSLNWCPKGQTGSSFKIRTKLCY